MIKTDNYVVKPSENRKRQESKNKNIAKWSKEIQILEEDGRPFEEYEQAILSYGSIWPPLPPRTANDNVWKETRKQQIFSIKNGLKDREWSIPLGGFRYNAALTIEQNKQLYTEAMLRTLVTQIGFEAIEEKYQEEMQLGFPNPSSRTAFEMTPENPSLRKEYFEDQLSAMISSIYHTTKVFGQDALIGGSMGGKAANLTGDEKALYLAKSIRKKSPSLSDRSLAVEVKNQGGTSVLSGLESLRKKIAAWVKTGELSAKIPAPASRSKTERKIV